MTSEDHQSKDHQSQDHPDQNPLTQAQPNHKSLSQGHAGKDQLSKDHASKDAEKATAGPSVNLQAREFDPEANVEALAKETGKAKPVFETGRQLPHVMEYEEKERAEIQSKIKASAAENLVPKTLEGLEEADQDPAGDEVPEGADALEKNLQTQGLNPVERRRMTAKMKIENLNFKETMQQGTDVMAFFHERRQAIQDQHSDLVRDRRGLAYRINPPARIAVRPPTPAPNIYDPGLLGTTGMGSGMIVQPPLSSLPDLSGLASPEGPGASLSSGLSPSLAGSLSAEINDGFSDENPALAGPAGFVPMEAYDPYGAYPAPGSYEGAYPYEELDSYQEPFQGAYPYSPTLVSYPPISPLDDDTKPYVFVGERKFQPLASSESDPVPVPFEGDPLNNDSLDIDELQSQEEQAIARARKIREVWKERKRQEILAKSTKRLTPYYFDPLNEDWSNSNTGLTCREVLLTFERDFPLAREMQLTQKKENFTAMSEAIQSKQTEAELVAYAERLSYEETCMLFPLLAVMRSNSLIEKLTAVILCRASQHLYYHGWVALQYAYPRSSLQKGLGRLCIYLDSPEKAREREQSKSKSTWSDQLLSMSLENQRTPGPSKKQHFNWIAVDRISQIALPNDRHFIKKIVLYLMDNWQEHPDIEAFLNRYAIYKDLPLYESIKNQWDINIRKGSLVPKAKDVFPAPPPKWYYLTTTQRDQAGKPTDPL